jgi:hypothetical protein
MEVACSLASIGSKTALRHQYWVKHEELPLLLCQLEDSNNVI